MRRKPSTGTRRQRVFISYSHEDANHDHSVRELADSLSRRTDVRFDGYFKGAPREGWPAWTERELSNADYVVLVFSPTYRRRWEGTEPTGVGLGAVWETQMARTRLYAEGNYKSVIPVYFARGSVQDIPDVLRYNSAHYQLPDQYAGLEDHVAGPTEEILGKATMEDASAVSASIREALAALDVNIDRLTEEQTRVIDQLRGRRRVLISGCAGSGKTLVAAEKAIRLSRAGLSTFFVCHNPLLADWVVQLTQGSGVAVESFGAWVSRLAGETRSKSSVSWTNYEEPAPDVVNKAFDALSEQGPRFDAVIVDEGQDFRTEWWALLEAALANGSSPAAFYIFHDDYQALLPHRSNRTSFPVESAPLDLSRNCRNAGRVYELMRIILPNAPLGEQDLRTEGEVAIWTYGGAGQTESVREALSWLSGKGSLGTCVALLGGGLAYEDSVLASRSFSVASCDWRKSILSGLERAYSASDPMIVRPRENSVNRLRQELSQSALPTNKDLSAIRRVLRLWSIYPELRQPDIRRHVRQNFTSCGGRIDRVWNSWSARDFLLLLEDEWSNMLPPPVTFRFAHHTKATPREVPVFTVGEYKGLEAESVLLLVDRAALNLMHEIFVGASRARRFLSMVIDEHTASEFPQRLRTYMSRGDYGA